MLVLNFSLLSCSLASRDGHSLTPEMHLFPVAALFVLRVSKIARAIFFSWGSFFWNHTTDLCQVVLVYSVTESKSQ